MTDDNKPTADPGSEEEARKSTTFQAMGRFFFHFSQLEFTIRVLLAAALKLSEVQLDIVTSTYDFRVLCTVTKSILVQKFANQEADIESLFKRCLSLNEKRVQVAHGLWSDDGNTLTARHVSGQTLEACRFFENPKDLNKLSDDAQALMAEILFVMNVGNLTETTIEVFKIPISKSQLRAIPSDERNLLLLASHAVNQLSVLRKLLLFSVNFESGNELENTLSAAQSQTILRFLFGALAEAWEMVRRPINQKLIGTDYIKVVGAEGEAAYTELNKHFGASNLLHNIRNKMTYHHPSPQELELAFENVPEDEEWAWYPSGTIDNSFYLASDMVISSGIMNQTGETDITKAFQKIMCGFR
jgi:hypothetical protein